MIIKLPLLNAYGGLGSIFAWWQTLNRAAGCEKLQPLKVTGISRDWKTSFIRLHLKVKGLIVRMSDWLFDKSPMKAAEMFEKVANVTNILASNEIYLVEAANPVNWHVHSFTEEPMFLCPHFILTKQQNEVQMKDLIYIVSVSKKDCISFRNQKNVLA